MRLFHDTIEALGEAQSSERDAFAVVDEAVGWTKLLRAQGEVKELADLADEDLLQGAADRYLTLRKFAPDLLEALKFKAARARTRRSRRSACCETSTNPATAISPPPRQCPSERTGSG